MMWHLVPSSAETLHFGDQVLLFHAADRSALNHSDGTAGTVGAVRDPNVENEPFLHIVTSAFLIRS
jgi:hypothetical protein